jgi:hypothetical protein
MEADVLSFRIESGWNVKEALNGVVARAPP